MQKLTGFFGKKEIFSFYCPNSIKLIFLRYSAMRILLSLILICNFSGLVYGQEALLWEISGKGLQSPSYLLGTLHAYCIDDVSLPAGTEIALQQCDKLVLEAEISNPQVAGQLLPLMRMRNGQLLTSLFAPGDYEVVEEYFQDSLGVNLELLSRYQPLYLSSLLYAKVLQCPIQSMEMYLAGRATQYGIQVEGLESPEEQARIISRMPYEEQANFLLQAIVEMDSLRAAYWDAVVSYKNRDLSSLFYALKIGQLGSPSYTTALLDDRNHRWVPRIEQKMSKAPSLIAVGAGHLPGPAGLIELLQRRGYTVQPVD